MMTDERTDVRAGGVEFELSVGQTIHEFTPVEEIADNLAKQARVLFMEALKGHKTAKGRINLKLQS